jgi:glucose-6-phosphate isomerase
MDLSRMRFADDFLASMESRLHGAFKEMDALEAGAIANPDEGRMVGHYWLRNAELAPTPQIRDEIESTIRRIQAFATEVHAGAIRGQRGPFKNLLVIGIGGSCLGPQFVAHALGHPRTNQVTPYFFDNTDPDGMERVLATIGAELGQTLCVVISKSGGTKETRNGMVEAAAAFEQAGLKFNEHAVAITRDGSQLHKVATSEKWITAFPMWDWVGGRTSELSAVGLLPAALQGFDIKSLLSGARLCDIATRTKGFETNPAAQLALMWFHAGNGVGSKHMVVLPYCDRLELFSKYLQQLVMESLGKKLDRAGTVVHQGLTVLGNKGATDQHSYIQQLRDGINDYFATFIQVLRLPSASGALVEGEFRSTDYLAGFYLGTRHALSESDRESVSISVD